MQSNSRFPKLTPRSSNISALPLFENDEHDFSDDSNLIMVNESEYNRNSDRMSDETETHQPNYLANASVHHEKEDGSGILTEEDVTKILAQGIKKNAIDQKSLSQLIKNIQDKNDVADDKQSIAPNGSNSQILRLQQQLNDLSEKLKETQQIHQQIQLMHHSPLNYSNQTHRICANYSNTSLSSHISHMSHNTSYSMPHLINKSSNRSNNTVYNYPYYMNYNCDKKKSKNSKKSKQRKPKRTKRRNSKAICCNVAEKRYRKKKKVQRQKSSIWPSFKCLDLRLCFSQTDGISHAKEVACVHSL